MATRDYWVATRNSTIGTLQPSKTYKVYVWPSYMEWIPPLKTDFDEMPDDEIFSSFCCSGTFHVFCAITVSYVATWYMPDV